MIDVPVVVFTSVISTAMPAVTPAAASAAVSTLISAASAMPLLFSSTNSSTSVWMKNVGVVSLVTLSLFIMPVSLAGSRCTPVGTGVGKFSNSKA